LSYYEVLFFLHIGAAMIWLGSAVLFFVIFQRAKQAQDMVLVERLGAHTEWLARRLFIPASLSVLVLGILLTIEGSTDDLGPLVIPAIALAAAGFLAFRAYRMGQAEATPEAAGLGRSERGVAPT
jgi:uncharacterized membrane protein